MKQELQKTVKPLHPLHRKLAVALQYEPNQGQAPKVVASGQGRIAERIIDTAIQAGVRVQENEPLAQALSAVEVNEEIPPDLYDAVAELFAFLYRSDMTSEAMK